MQKIKNVQCINLLLHLVILFWAPFSPNTPVQDFPHFESVLSLYTAITSCEKNRRFPGNGFLLNLKNKLKITFKKVLLVFTELW